MKKEPTVADLDNLLVRMQDNLRMLAEDDAFKDKEKVAQIIKESKGWTAEIIEAREKHEEAQHNAE